MTSSKLLALLLLPVSWIVWTVYSLVVNYAIARKVGVPLIVLPISPENPVWMLIDKYFVSLLKRVPFGSGTFTRYGYRGWQFDDRYKTHLQLGDVFMTVTPGKNWLCICNAEALADIIHRRNEFKRPLEILQMLNVFGPNVSTVEGQDWQRHRKVTGPPFNEQNNNLVWHESLRQAKEMLQYWIGKYPEPVRTTAKDAKTFSLHVLSGAGFGKSHPFQPITEEAENGQSLSYKDSLSLVLDNAILIMILGPKFLAGRFLPKSWARVGQATVDFKRYMKEMLEEERRLIVQGKPSASNLMTSLIRASEEVTEAANGSTETKDAPVTRHHQAGLTESEIFGNIFVFNFAGHDTTAHTLAFALILLTGHPEAQDWIAEEIQYVLPDSDSSKWDYEATFPKLKRCLAILLETLRLYDPVLGFVKATGSAPRTLTVAGQSLLIPANTMVAPSIMAIHSHPRYWGSDSLIWRPSRWIIPSPSDDPVCDRESLFTPPKGAYLPWSDGARGCPGKKFAQVEFVAAMAALFRDYKVEPVPERGESMEMARKRVNDVVNDSGMVLLLQILHPEKAGVRWVKR